MSEVSTIGLDIAKNVFQAHGADARGRQLFNRRIARGKVIEFFTEQAKCLVAMEACGGAHHWARELTRLGEDSLRSGRVQTVRLGFFAADIGH